MNQTSHRRMHWAGRLRAGLGYLRKHRRGASGAIIAASIVPGIAATGAAIDLARLAVARSQLSAAVDSAALAGGRAYFQATTTRNAEIMRYFNANFNKSNFGVTGTPSVTISPTDSPNPSLDQQLQRLSVDASVTVPTYFMRMFGVNSIAVAASAEATRQQTGLELVLALDNTGSMATADAGGGKTRIQALKEAASELVNILYGGTPANTANPNLRVGVLPYSHGVNVGHFLEMEGMLDIPADMATFVARGKTDRADGVYNDAWGWKGCIEERQTVNNLAFNLANLTMPVGAHDLHDIPPGVDGHVMWRPYYYPSFVQNGNVYNGYNAPAGYPVARRLSNDGYTETGTQAPGAGWSNAQLAVSGNSPNRACHSEAILPSASQTREGLLGYISTKMGTEGYTYSDLGMNWAIKILSPEAPIASPVPWNNPTMEKAIVLMTDGVITGGSDQMGNRIGYTSYGRTQESRVWTSISESNWASTHEQRLAILCQAAKDKGIRVYTVTLAFNATEYAAKRPLYEGCAIPGGHFNAPTGTALSEAFRMIATDLSQLRLSK